MIRIDPLFYLFFALLVLILPLDWILSALAAAIFHELCHIAATYLLGGTVHSLKIGIGGAVIEADLQSSSREFWCTAAGPAGSFLLLALHMKFPKLAICAGIQGLFNLIPVHPLDGGRLLRIILEKLCPMRADRVGQKLEIGVMLVIAAVSLTTSILYSLGILPPVMAAVWIIKSILRKIPCKQGENRVQ